MNLPFVSAWPFRPKLNLISGGTIPPEPHLSPNSSAIQIESPREIDHSLEELFSSGMYEYIEFRKISDSTTILEKSEKTLTLAVSDYLYNHVEQIADNTASYVEQVLGQQLEEAFTKLPAFPSSDEDDRIHIQPLSGPEIIERGLLGGWADKGIEDSAAWVEKQRRKRNEENKW